MSLRPLSSLLKSRNLLKGSRHSISWRLHNQEKNMKKKQVNINPEPKPPLLVQRINKMNLQELFEAIDNGELENDRDLIYIITAKLIRISNSLIRQYSLDVKALKKMYRTFLKTGEFVRPTDEDKK